MSIQGDNDICMLMITESPLSGTLIAPRSLHLIFHSSTLQIIHLRLCSLIIMETSYQCPSPTRVFNFVR